MKKYFKLFICASKISIMQQMDYRLNFYFAVFAKLIRIGIYLYFFKAVYLNVPQIAGWSLYEIVLLFSIYSIVDYIANITFARNLVYSLPWEIQSGDFDLKLTKPANKLFMSAFMDIDIMDLVSFVPILFIFIYSIYKLSIVYALSKILLFILLISTSVIFIFSIYVLVSSIFFWTIQGRGLGMTVSQIIGLGQWPTDIYRGNLHTLFNIFLPIVMVATLPAKTLIGKPIDLWLIVYAILITIMLLIISLISWQEGLKHYSSASS